MAAAHCGRRNSSEDGVGRRRSDGRILQPGGGVSGDGRGEGEARSGALKGHGRRGSCRPGGVGACGFCPARSSDVRACEAGGVLGTGKLTGGSGLSGGGTRAGWRWAAARAGERGEGVGPAQRLVLFFFVLFFFYSFSLFFYFFHLFSFSHISLFFSQPIILKLLFANQINKINQNPISNILFKGIMC